MHSIMPTPLKLILPLVAVALCACNTMYEAPKILSAPRVFSVTGTKETLYQKAAAALIAEGFAITSSDAGLGIISTHRREMVLTEADVDLGTTMGIAYIKDKRTTEYVTVTIQVEADKATIRTDIDGEYLPNDAVYGKKMKGVSKGTIEQKIADRMK